MRIAQRIIQKRRAIVDDIDGKAVLRFDSFQPLYGDGGSVFQAGSDRTDVILKRAELVFGKAAFGNRFSSAGPDRSSSTIWTFASVSAS